MLKELLKGFSHDIVEVLGDALRDIYHLLKQIEWTERDELTRIHAQAALGALDTIMREFLFPEPSLSKKITVLDKPERF